MNVIRMSVLRLRPVFLGVCLIGVLGLGVMFGPASAYAQSPSTHDLRTPAPGTIQLKNGQTLDGRLALHLGGYNPRLEYVGGDQLRTIPITDVRAFRHGERYVVNHGVVRLDHLTQSAVEERLIVRHVEGRLDLYAPMGATRPRFPYAYFSKGNGPIREMSYSNLRDAVQDDAESAALMASSRRWHYAQYGLLVGGAVTTSLGMMRSFNTGIDSGPGAKDDPSVGFAVDSLLFVGLGIVATSFIARAQKHIRFRRAIKAYNR